MKRLFITLPGLFLFGALAACDDPPQPPTYAEMQLQYACQSGNIQACAVMEQNRVQQQIAYQQNLTQQFSSFAQNTYQPRYAVCNPNYYNSGVSCYNY